MFIWGDYFLKAVYYFVKSAQTMITERTFFLEKFNVQHLLHKIM